MSAGGLWLRLGHDGRAALIGDIGSVVAPLWVDSGPCSVGGLCPLYLQQRLNV